MDTELDIISKYKELVSSSLDGSSIYIRTKETLQEMLDKGEITEDEKSTALASILGSINNGILSSSMSMALQWSTAEKELLLKKKELEKQLEVMEEDIDLKEAQTEKVKYDNYTTQATSLRTNGSFTTVNGEVVSLSDSGSKYEEIQLIKAKTISENANRELIDGKKREVNTSIHKIIADTYVNYGTFNGYTISDSGITGVVPGTTHNTLSDKQGAIAQEQIKGYAYNAWSNAASGLGATIGTALTTESDIFGGTESYPDILGDWATIVKKLKDVQVNASV